MASEVLNCCSEICCSYDSREGEKKMVLKCLLICRSSHTICLDSGPCSKDTQQFPNKLTYKIFVRQCSCSS
ncbi:hypothetical protein BRADI_4g44325v3 [Brachypodium distachyon]|uniref:Uncharacterized protein n=1 Tax=Brachypodium distachyon TaxID=15368 RepID=A0A2K2CU49_BRADI|nr:hypothetical protein BRADI_4g44325v3 [Brachypodium distachyon]